MYYLWKIQIFCDMTWSHWASTCQSFEGSQYHCFQYRSFQCSATARFWKWRNYDPLQRWRQSAQWHSIISQKTWTISTSAVRITDLTFYGSPLNLPPVTQQTTLHYNNVMLRSNLHITGFLTLPQSHLIIKSVPVSTYFFFFVKLKKCVTNTFNLLHEVYKEGGRVPQSSHSSLQVMV
jgi:hypothetical protein